MLISNITRNKENKYTSLDSILNQKTAIILSLLLGGLFILLILIGDFFNKTHNHNIVFEFNENIILNILIRYLTNVFMLYTLYRFSFWIFLKNLETRKKYLFSALGVFLLSSIMSLLISNFIYVFSVDDNFYLNFLLLVLIKDLMTSVIVFFSTLSIYIIVRNHQVLIENQKLSLENIKNRYEALKNQIDPHFLFNSLNTLDGLISLENNKAHNYLQRLSSTFRYIMQNKEITSLSEELKFVDSYAYLMKIRYSNNLHIKYAIDTKYLSYYIMPISIQLLIENAIKHNIINNKYNLVINIQTTDYDTIKVENTIKPKVEISTTKGIGLKNLSERYKLLFNEDVKIISNSVFSVEIPLIKQNDNFLI